MSSAAKLRKYGRGTATVAAAALVMTSFGPAAFASFDATSPGQDTTYGAPFSAQELGTIGIVDSAPGSVAGDQAPAIVAAPNGTSGAEQADENQGAPLVWAGKDGQDIADVRLVIPNRFRSGDIIDLRLLDRSATEHTNGNTNATSAKSLGFAGTPKVSVNSDPKVGNVAGTGWVIAGASGNEAIPSGTQVSSDTDAVGTGVSNTETGAKSWSPDGRISAATPASAAERTKPGAAPDFIIDKSQDAAVQGSNNIRIRVTNASTGDPNGAWVVTLSDLQVNLGLNVTPGELRLVPFASSTTDGGTTYTPSNWFAGNTKEVVTNGVISTQREIGIYTVPAYVAPVTMTVGTLDIQADSTPQTVGDLVIEETQGYSLPSGTYTVNVAGASIANAAADIKAKVENGGTSESVSNVSLSGNTLTFTLSNGDNNKKSKITLSGLMLATNSPSSIKLTLGGSAISQWLPVAGTSTLSIPQTSDSVAIHPDNWFEVEGGGTETALVAPAVVGVTPTTNVAAGDAAKFPLGVYTFANSSPAAYGSSNAKISAAAADMLGAGTYTVAATGDADVLAVTNATGLIGTYTLSTNTLSVTTAGTGAGANTGTVQLATDLTVAADNGFTVVQELDLFVDADGAGPGTPVKVGTTSKGLTQYDVDQNATTTGDVVTFAANPTAVSTFTVAVSGGGTAVTEPGVNQDDILPDEALKSLTASAVAISPSARIGGNNRYETAAKIAEAWAMGNKSLANGKLKNVIIASGENFPDALSAAYLSQRMGAPILLTMKSRLPSDTIEALRDRQVEKVFVIGGESAVSPEVVGQITGLKSYYYDTTDSTVKAGADNLQAVRLGGDSRYTTNQLVNMYAAAWAGESTIGKTVYKYGQAGKNTAIFARGDNFPDALAAGVLTRGVAPGALSDAAISSRALPLVLTAPDSLAVSAKQQIERLDVEHGIIVGDTTAITDNVKKSIEDMGLTNTRLGGKDRYFTAAAVDEFAMRPSVASPTNEYPGLGFLVDQDGAGTADDAVLTSYLATGLKFPDALTASPWIGRNRDALNLVWPNALTDGTGDFLSKRAADISRAIGLGLGDAVSTKVLAEANKIVSAK